jgi:hypothetical protein
VLVPDVDVEKDAKDEDGEEGMAKVVGAFILVFRL